MSPPQLPAVEDVSSAELLEHVLPVLLPYLPYKSTGQMRTLSRSFKLVLDTEAVWQQLCECLAAEHQLYCPQRYQAGYRRLFLELLYPARRLWDANARAGQSPPREYRVQVCVRMRPPAQHSHSCGAAKGMWVGMLLPLHQRLRVLSRGEKLGPTNQYLSAKQLQELLPRGGEPLSAEVLQALADAQHLSSAAHRHAQLAQDALHSCKQQPNGALPQCLEDAENLPPEVQQLLGMREQRRQEAQAARHRQLQARAGQAHHGHAGDRVREGEGRPASEPVAEKGARQSPWECAQVVGVAPTRVSMLVPGVGLRHFHFPGVFDGGASQELVYHNCARTSVVAALNGFNATLLCYGPAGSGKSHTMLGPRWLWAGRDSHLEQHGLVLRSLTELLERVAHCAREGHCHLQVQLQYVQIYNEQITCLLSGTQVHLESKGGDATGATCACSLPFQFRSWVSLTAFQSLCRDHPGGSPAD